MTTQDAQDPGMTIHKNDTISVTTLKKQQAITVTTKVMQQMGETRKSLVGQQSKHQNNESGSDDDMP